MGFYLANYLKYQGWGKERVLAGEISASHYLTGVSLLRQNGPMAAAYDSRLLILTAGFFQQPDWPMLLPRLKQAGGVALAYPGGKLPKEILEQARPLCQDLDLPLLALGEDLFIYDLLVQSEMLLSIDDQGQAVTVTEAMRLLRQAVAQDKISGLLGVLQTWLRCQAILAIKHDLYACPALSEFEEAPGDYRDWQRLYPAAPLPWIDVFYNQALDAYDLRCQILYDGMPLGFLSLRRARLPFDEKELKAADYAAILCAGLNHTFAKSQAIQDFLAGAYYGKSPDSVQAGLVAESGYALVLREIPGPGRETRAKRADTEENHFLGYLIQTNLGQATYHAFLDNGDLAVFCQTGDIRAYTRDLLALLRKNRRGFLAGVSQRYDRAEIAGAFAEAKHAMNIGQYLDDQQEAFFFRDMGIYRVFNYPEHSWSINQMLNEMAAKLREVFDREKSDMLTNTLICLVRNSFNYSKAAEELFTHPNTIRYRMRLLEELWDKDLSKDEDRLLLSVVGKLLPLWQRYTGQQNE